MAHLLSVKLALRVQSSHVFARQPLGFGKNLMQSLLAALFLSSQFTCFCMDLTFISFGHFWIELYGFGLLELAAVTTVVGVADIAGEVIILTVMPRTSPASFCTCSLLLSAVAFATFPVARASVVLAAVAWFVAVLGFECTAVSLMTVVSRTRVPVQEPPAAAGGPSTALPFKAALRPRSGLLPSASACFNGIGRCSGTALGPFVWAQFGVEGFSLLPALFSLAAFFLSLAFLDVDAADDTGDTSGAHLCRSQGNDANSVGKETN